VFHLSTIVVSMKLLKRVQEFAAFTKNEQRIFLFLSIVFIAGVSVKVYRAYFTPPPARQFDYSASDKEFEERSKYLTSAPPAGEPSDTAGETGSRSAKKKVNLNTATKDDLVILPGIGETLAEQILIYRDEHGEFSSVEQLRKIKGIGAKKFEKLRPHVKIK
jgi:comEA protein